MVAYLEVDFSDLFNVSEVINDIINQEEPELLESRRLVVL